MRFVAILLIPFLFSPSLLKAEGAKQLTWFVTDVQPIYFPSGKERGTFNIILDLFDSKMTSYQAKRKMMNFHRVWSEIKKGIEICHPGSYVINEYRSFALFSRPFGALQDQQVVMNESLFKKLGSPHSISLKEFFKNTSLRTADTRYSYGMIIDELIKTNRPKKHDLISKPENIYKMLKSERIDYYLEYPYIISYFNKREENSQTKIVTVPISEAISVSTLHVACPKTKWGKKVIDDINVAIGELIQQKSYQEVWLNWAQSPEESKEIEKAYQEKILNYQVEK